MTAPCRILILGGTGEASELARALTVRFGAAVQVTSSQAGRTREPRAPAGALRIGGFGGAVGLAAYLTGQDIDLVIDATHPFASAISANARAACNSTGCRRLILARPPWQQRPGDDWHHAANATAAAALVAQMGPRVFMTVGRKDLSAFSGLSAHWFLVRLIDRPVQTLPLPRHQILIGRGPFTLATERALLRHHEIDVLVTKASGGSATEAKLLAAREANLPVIMLQRPLSETGEQVDCLAAALTWVSHAFELQAPL